MSMAYTYRTDSIAADISNAYFDTDCLEYLSTSSTTQYINCVQRQHIPDICFNKLDISSMEKTNVDLRKRLDSQLYQLHHGVNYSDSAMMMDATVMASLCWTVLATSIIYVIFIEM
jgi:hypothetical protein